MTHDERSKSMNSRAFSCGERSPLSQPPGGGEPPMLFSVSVFSGLPETCRSLKTARPQYAGDVAPAGVGAFTGVSNEKYIVWFGWPDAVSDVIHGCEGLSAALTIALYRGE